MKKLIPLLAVLLFFAFTVPASQGEKAVPQKAMVVKSTEIKASPALMAAPITVEKRHNIASYFKFDQSAPALCINPHVPLISSNKYLLIKPVRILGCHELHKVNFKKIKLVNLDKPPLLLI